jgi:hypothetical protein
MNSLVPEPRQDKNGRLTNRWVKSGTVKRSLEAEIERQVALNKSLEVSRQKYIKIERVIKAVQDAGQESNRALNGMILRGDYPEEQILDVVRTYRTSSAEQIKVILDGGLIPLSEGTL